jgi:putative ABC transport system permease protein
MILSLSDSTTEEINATLLTAFNYNEDGFLVTNLNNILDTVEEMTNTMTMMLAGLAGISLLVGGIGIMNMMLVSVTERTTEIGLRKALGSEPRIIQTQFILEALFLSLFGGVLGIIVGFSIAFAGASLIDTSFVLSGNSFYLL